jgi:hypothetical protein
MGPTRFFGVVQKEMRLFCFALKVAHQTCNPVLNKSSNREQMAKTVNEDERSCHGLPLCTGARKF